MPHPQYLLFFYFVTLTASLLLLFGLFFLLNRLSRIKMHGFVWRPARQKELGKWQGDALMRMSEIPLFGQCYIYKVHRKVQSQLWILLWIMSLLTAASLHFAVLSKMKHIVECNVWKKAQIQNARSQCWNSRHQYDAPSNLRLDAFNIYSFFTRMSACINTSITWSWPCGPRWNMIIITIEVKSV